MPARHHHPSDDGIVAPDNADRAPEGTDGDTAADSQTVDSQTEVIDEPTPWWGPVALTCFVALVVCTNVANSVWARWVDTRPAALLALSSRNRYLLLTLPEGVSLWQFAVIAFLRLWAAWLVCYLIGRSYSTKVMHWFARYLGVSHKQQEQFRQGFTAAEWVLVPFFVGSNIVAAIAGLERAPLRRMAALVSIGITARLVAMWWLARNFEEQLKDILAVLQRYQTPVVIVSVALVVLANIRNFRAGRSG